MRDFHDGRARQGAPKAGTDGHDIGGAKSAMAARMEAESEGKVRVVAQGARTAVEVRISAGTRSWTSPAPARNAPLAASAGAPDHCRIRAARTSDDNDPTDLALVCVVSTGRQRGDFPRDDQVVGHDSHPSRGTRRRFMSAAAYPAPKPLSMFTTVTPEAQLFNIASSAASPWKLDP